LPFCIRTVAEPQTVVRVEAMVVLGAAVVLVVKVEFWVRAVPTRLRIMGKVSFMIFGFDAAVETVFYFGLLDSLS
jgi:hypothetical protein